jgi:hypothetical protein
VLIWKLLHALKWSTPLILVQGDHKMQHGVSRDSVVYETAAQHTRQCFEA